MATTYKSPDPELVAIGERIRIRREALHMSQEELGLAIGADKVTIHRYESGKVEMKCRTLQKIAKSLRTTTDALLEDKQEEPQIDTRLLEACKGASGLDSASIEKLCWMIQMTAAGAEANISTT